LIKRDYKILPITLFFLIFFPIVSFAQDILQTTISLQIKDKRIEEVFEIISKETGIIFTYSPNHIPIKQKVSIRANNNELSDVIDQFLAPYCSNIKYLVSNERLTIKAKKKALVETKSNYGVISGLLIDQENYDPLPGASIFLPAYNKGLITNERGKFKLSGVPKGKHTLEIHYIGYKPITKYLDLKNDSLSLMISLERDMTYLSEIMVFGQLEGQQLAVKEQQKHPTIVNIVSKDKIGQLPDQNVAEAVGRLPGVSVIRNGGEGQFVVLRGVSPRLSAITINGERIPPTSIQERTVDLTMLSPELLSGLELFKAITPDQDADATGGIINFTIKKAEKPDWKAHFSGQYGYNSHQNALGQYKLNFNLGKRILNNKLGILVSGNLQKADRSSDAFGANVRFTEFDENGNPNYAYEDINLNDRLEKRYRYGGSLVLDYTFSTSSFIEYYSVFGRIDRFETRRRQRYQVEDSKLGYDINIFENNISLYSNILNGKHQLLGNWELTWRVSNTFSENASPFDHTARFRELAAFNSKDENSINSIINAAKNNLSNTFFHDSRFDTDRIGSHHTSSQIDLKIPLRLGNKITSYFKTGGKLRYQNQQRTVDRLWTESQGTNEIASDYPGLYSLSPSGSILINNFTSNTEIGNFLNGAYDYSVWINEDKVNDFYLKHRDGKGYYTDDRVSYGSYKANELISSFYFMGRVDFNERLMFLGGIRHEQTSDRYESNSSIISEDTEGQTNRDESSNIEPFENRTNNVYSEWLPMFHFRYTIQKDLILKAAITKSIYRPAFLHKTPWERIIPNENLIERGNPLLEHATTWNYDIALSSKLNKVGFVSIALFYKNIDQLDFIRQGIQLNEGNTFGYDLIQPENIGQNTKIRGIEFEWQTNFTWLPDPFNGLLFSANASLIRSQTWFPVLLTAQSPFRVIYGERKGSLPGQANLIYNLSLGYERKGFSGRISAIYQGISLSHGEQISLRPGGYSVSVGKVPEEDVFSKPLFRIDLALRQKITKHAALFLNANNISNQYEQEFINGGLITRTEYFGFTADIGCRINF